MLRHAPITLVAIMILGACGTDFEQQDDLFGLGSQEHLLSQSFDIHNLMSDAELTGGANITVEMVQEFLEMKGSYLASYVDPRWNKSAARLIVERSRTHGISPLYMVARIQTESSLITSGTSRHLAAATGCGCPDGADCAAEYQGFGNQVECGAQKIRGYLNDLDAGRSTVSGWRPGTGKNTLDPCWVVPANRATAALYTYTPWVGAYGRQCNARPDVGGSTLLALAYDRYQNEYDWSAAGTTPSTPPPPPAPSPPTGTTLLQGIVHEAGDTGRRIAGATVQVAGLRLTTNSHGHYSVEVSPGAYTVTASAEGYRTAAVSRIVPAGSQSWASVGLSRQEAVQDQARLVGVVYESPSSARRLAGASVRLSSGATSVTDSHGFFAFSVAPGTYTVTASRPGFQTASVSRRVGSGATIWGSVGLRRAEARGTVRGVVYESPHTNRRLAGAVVTLSNGMTATSAANGHFSFEVAPGTYRITAERAGYSPASVIRRVESNGEIWGSVGLAKVMVPTGDLIGVVYAAPDTADRIAGARVWTSTGQSTYANANGVYTLSGVPAGQVTIYAGATGLSSGSVDRTVRAGEQIWGSIGLSRGALGEEADEGGMRLIAPVDGDLASSNPQFEWENLDAETAGSSPFSYRLVVVCRNGHQSFEGAVTGSVGGTTRSSIGLSLESGRWYWSVYAFNDSGDLLASSRMGQFEVQ